MVNNAHMEFVNALQQHLLAITGESLERDSLLLSFGVLASRAQPDVELTIANFLIQLDSTVSDNDTSAHIHLLLAMGNTGSKYVISTILSYIDHPAKDIQTASIGALVKFTYLEQVQDRLAEVLTSEPDEEMLNTVTQTLIKGQVYAEGLDIDMKVGPKHPLLPTLVSTVLKTNDTDLIGRVSIYVGKISGEQAAVLLDQLHIRLRRGTDWDASNSDYNCVASQSSRASDVSTYPKHRDEAVSQDVTPSSFTTTEQKGSS